MADLKPCPACGADPQPLGMDVAYRVGPVRFQCGTSTAPDGEGNCTTGPWSFLQDAFDSPDSLAVREAATMWNAMPRRDER